ncbi:hypothetical protein MKW94_017859 [Papaver nudicaule]|uniref:Uncharacterized protein n=1 Tax=Papaver nudicaule TaxID=74823 RepID=A0AA41VL44_PAPNU|nr:hypothetical protein [Papaver nudicaule]
MAVVVINNAIRKHSSSSSSLSSGDRLIPFTIFDKAAVNCHLAAFYAFKPPIPSNEVLKEALSKVLVHFPHLAGRFVTDNLGQPCIILNNAGVRIIETYIDTTLAKKLPFHPTKDVRHLVPPVEGRIEELCQIQLNRYACGGLVLGFTYHHSVADGQSVSCFLFAWARIIRGLDLEPLPYHDRHSVCRPRNPPRVEFDHSSIEFKKPSLVDTNIPAGYETKVTQARQLDLEESTQVKVAVNGRERIVSKPAVPIEYWGNLVLWAYPSLKVKELLNKSHAYVAKTIRDEVSRVDDRYFKSFIDFGAADQSTGGGGGKDRENGFRFGGILCPNIKVDSYLRFQFHSLDFGSGSPCAVFPANLPREGLVVFMPSKTEDGGVDVIVTLLVEHVPLFKQISHSIITDNNRLSPKL